MEPQDNIDAQVITYGVAVHGDTDSGWQVTGFTKGLDPQKSFKLAAFTSVGEISETWARIFENGYAYFGRMPDENRAVFALFYRSPVPSARGRHFVPKIVLSIPYQDYVGKLNCDPMGLFRFLEQYKIEKVPSQSKPEPTPLEPFYDLFSLPLPNLKEQLQPLELALNGDTSIQNFLIDFLSAILRPNPHCTLIWGGEKPDANLVLSILFLLPRHLRQWITFCTSVENPRVGNLRIKIIKEPVGPENNSIAIMKDNRFTLNKKKPTFETQLPQILVAELMVQRDVGINNIAELLDFVDTKLSVESGMNNDYNKILKKAEVLATLHQLKKQVKTSRPPDNVFKPLLCYSSELQIHQKTKTFESPNILEDEFTFIAERVEMGVLEIENEDQLTKVLDELRQLVQVLPELHETDYNSFFNTLMEKGRQFTLKSFLPLLKVFYSIPNLKNTIDSQLFKNLKLKQNPGWEESFELLTLMEYPSQCDHLKNENPDLYNVLKQQPGLDFFIDLLGMALSGRESDSSVSPPVFEKIALTAKDDYGRVFKIIIFCLKRMGEFEPGEHYFRFLLVSAQAYGIVNEMGVETRNEFQEHFVQRFYQLCHLELDNQKKELVSKISEKIKSMDVLFASQLNGIMKQGNFSFYLAEFNQHMVDNGGINSFGKKGDIYRLLNQMDANPQLKNHPHLSTVALQMILAKNALPTPTVYGDYLDYLKQKRKMNDTDIQNLLTILTHDPSPMGYSHYLLDTLTLVFSYRNEQTLSRFVRSLLYFAQNYSKGKLRYISDIESSFMRIAAECWKPLSGVEVKEIYLSVKQNLDKSLGDKILKIGLSHLPEAEKMKYLSGEVCEFFEEFFLISHADLGYFKSLLTYIEMGNPETIPFLVDIQEDLKKIREDRDSMEESMDKIKTLLKKIKKLR